MVGRSWKECKYTDKKILIGNKCDLEEEREISKDEGEAFAMRNGMQYIIMIEYNNKKLCN